jgi:hypothetical protein
MQTFLAITWAISRGYETFGYNICRLYDSQTGKRYRCIGGGYDMIGTVVGQWLEDSFQPHLQQLDLSDAEGCSSRRHYGAIPDKDGTVHLDGGCGIESMQSIATAIGVELQGVGNKRGITTGFIAHWD